MIFCTAITRDYLGRAAPLLASLRRLRSCRKFVVTVGFEIPDQPDQYRNVTLAPTGQKANQQGQVLDVLPDVGDETLVMADSDAVVQRDLADDELDLFNGLGPTDIAMGPNILQPQTAAEEYLRLSPKRSLAEVAAALGSRLDTVPICNAGFVAAKPPVWRLLRKHYERLDALTSGMWGNWRACQLLFCVVVDQLGLRIVDVGRQTHSHYHDGPHPLNSIRDRKVYYGERLVFFAHCIPGITG